MEELPAKRDLFCRFHTQNEILGYQLIAAIRP
jgi:hypothetical protein